jgi:hypothetical protein
MRHPIFVLFLSAALSACVGGGGTNDPVDGDDDATDDPGDGSDGDGDGEIEPERPAACPAGEMGAVSALTDAEAYSDALEEAEDGPRVRYLWGGINDTSGFEIDLYDGYGAFKDAAAAPGSFTIGGEDADPELCGLCVYMWLDTDEWSYFLMADGGSVTLETVDGRLKGSASSLTFKEIGDEGDYMEGGCSATIESVPFDAAYYVEEEEPPT